MSETKFTPGPWVVGDRRLVKHLHGFHTIETPVHIGGRWPGQQRGNCIVICYGHGPNGESLADAQLIAAAPELYAVLAELEESAEYWGEYDVPLGIVDRIKAALTKARGDK